MYSIMKYPNNLSSVCGADVIPYGPADKDKHSQLGNTNESISNINEQIGESREVALSNYSEFQTKCKYHYPQSGKELPWATVKI